MSRPGLQRYLLKVAYDGLFFSGSQRQSHINDGLEGAAAGLATVQGTMEDAMSRWTRQPITTFFASRTDAGVHALDNALHLDLQRLDKNGQPVDDPYPGDVILRATNANLSHRFPNYRTSGGPLRVTEAHMVAPDFNARFDVSTRQYTYYINANTGVHKKRLFEGATVWHIDHVLDAETMREAVKALVGTHDYTTFRSSGCQAKTPIRTIHSFEIVSVVPQLHDAPSMQRLAFVVEGDAFLYHQVRNMVGALVNVGNGKNPPEWIGDILARKDRSLSPTMAPANALFLSRLKYNENFTRAVK